MSVEKRIHSGWEDPEKLKYVNNDPIFEKYQYIYSHDDSKISLVQFTPRMYGGCCWEIYQIEGKQQLFEDVERYGSKELAEERIKELFGVTTFD